MSWAKMRLATGVTTAFTSVGGRRRRNVTAAWRSVTPDSPGRERRGRDQVVRAQAVLDLGDRRHHEPVDVGDHPALRRQDAPGQARRPGLAHVLRLDPVVPCGGRPPRCPPAAARPGTARRAGTRCGARRGCSPGRRAASPSPTGSGGRSCSRPRPRGGTGRGAAAARPSPVGNTHTNPSRSTTGKTSTRRARRSGSSPTSPGTDRQAPAPVEAPAVVAALQLPVAHLPDRQGGVAVGAPVDHRRRPTVRHPGTAPSARPGRCGPPAACRPRSDDRQATYQWFGSRTSMRP